MAVVSAVGDVRLPSTVDEHPATSADAATSTAIRIPARLAARAATRGSGASGSTVSSLPSGSCTNAPFASPSTAAPSRASPATACTAGDPFPFARPPVGKLRYRAPAAGTAVAGCPVLPRVHLLRTATAQVHPARGRQVPADERGLPDAERGGAGVADRRSAAGDVLHPRRRLHHGQLGDADLRRRGPRPAWLRVRVGELPTRRAGLHGPVGAVDTASTRSTTTCSFGTW